MSGHQHHADDGGTYMVAPGDRAVCYICRRAILRVASHWRAIGPFLGPLPKSRRCTSRCPARGYLTCELARNHAASCHAGGFSWYRGKGHSRPFLIARPSWDPA